MCCCDGRTLPSISAVLTITFPVLVTPYYAHPRKFCPLLHFLFFLSRPCCHEAGPRNQQQRAQATDPCTTTSTNRSLRLGERSETGATLQSAPSTTGLFFGRFSCLPLAPRLLLAFVCATDATPRNDRPPPGRVVRRRAFDHNGEDHGPLRACPGAEMNGPLDQHPVRRHDTRNSEWCTVSFSWVSADSCGMERVAFCTKEVSGRHETADHIKPWLRQVRV